MVTGFMILLAFQTKNWTKYLCPISLLQTVNTTLQRKNASHAFRAIERISRLQSEFQNRILQIVFSGTLGHNDTQTHALWHICMSFAVL